MFTIRKAAAFALTSLLAASTILTASAQSTSKSLSSNFTLVNLSEGTNSGEIDYVLPNGDEWRPSQSFTFNTLGEQAIYRQYLDNELSSGSGSVVVSTDGPVGAVVQIQHRGTDLPTSGAYIGVSEGASSANVPLVSRRGGSLSGETNSQIIIQNASGQTINVEVDLINSSTGVVDHTEQFPNIPPNASVEFDLDNDVDDSEIPAGWFGSATVRSTTPGGEVAVVSNFFTGDHAMQTFNAFTQTGTEWVAPLFASRLSNQSGNPLSTPIAVQNVSGGTIPAGQVTLTCTRDPGSTSTEEPTLTRTNTTPIANTAAYFFNPAPEDSGYPAEWYGSCRVTTGSFQTAMFVQMRFVGATGHRAGAYEGILANGTDRRVVIPLIAKRLSNSFASAVTIQNLSTDSPANVTLEYKGVIDGTNNSGPCTATVTEVIPAGGSIIENHRVPDGATNSVPEIADQCVGSLTVTSSNQPIDAFVQLDFVTGQGDSFMAHNAFTVATTPTE